MTSPDDITTTPYFSLGLFPLSNKLKAKTENEIEINNAYAWCIRLPNYNMKVNISICKQKAAMNIIVKVQ